MADKKPLITMEDFPQKRTWFEIRFYGQMRRKRKARMAMLCPDNWTQEQALIGAQAISSAMNERTQVWKMTAELIEVRKSPQYVITEKELICCVLCQFEFTTKRHLWVGEGSEWYGPNPDGPKFESIPKDVQEAVKFTAKVEENIV